MKGLQLLPSPAFPDDRGRFIVAWRLDELRQLEGWAPFVQESLSESRRGVLRGLHMQHPRQQGKLVRVVHGHIYDVVVDLRPESATFRRWTAAHLSAAEAAALWIPPGLAHGFLVLSERASVLYQVTAPWDPSGEVVVRWDDPDLGIDWPLDAPPVLSARDAAAPSLSDAVRLLSASQQ